MTTRRMTLPKLTIGLDLGDRFTRLCTLDAHGHIRDTARLLTAPARGDGRPTLLVRRLRSEAFVELP